MNEPYEFVVYGKQEPAGSKRFVGMQKGKGRIIDSNKNARPWKNEVRQVAGGYMKDLPLLTGPVRVTFVFYRRRPQSHFNAAGEVKDRYKNARPTTKPDALKLARGVEDALTGIVYNDDAQIVDEVLAKLYGNPERVEIKVEEIT